MEIKKEKWESFKRVHSQPIINFVKSLLEDTISKEEFIKVYVSLSKSKHKIRNAKNAYMRLIKFNLIKVLKK